MKVTPTRFFNYNTIFDNGVNQDDWEMWIYSSGLLRARINTQYVEFNLGGINTEYEIVFTWEYNGDINLYVNGVLRDTATISAWVNPGELFFG